ncbi:unannotated protein [freshwater metagenome]|uniref:Unannotated protein n=1 Tax=freshwater metagenome TaxID=449393 RepID=A0A6J6TA84_9ZZZZ
MAVAQVRRGDGLESGDAIGARLADAHEDAGGERDAQDARLVERVEAALRILVGCPTMALEVGVERLDHHPLRRSNLSQQRELVVIQRTGIRVGQEAGLLEHHLGHRDQVVDGRFVAVIREPTGRHRVPQLGAFAKGEQGLVTSQRRAGAGDGEHVGGGEVGRVDSRRRFGEGAVPTLVATQHREGDEDLGRVRDARASGGVAYLACLVQQIAEWRRE